MTASAWTTTTGDDAILATAIHAGHSLRPEVAKIAKLSDADRLREEDPFTDRWVRIAENSMVVDRSRFEVDLNRARDKAVYIAPEDAWGLDLWTSEPTADMVAATLEIYDRFYLELGELCDQIIEAHGHVVVLDLHSYNHRRKGPDAAVDDPDMNPDINLGTESIATSWAPVVAAFSDAMANYHFFDDRLDVRANVKFKGGHMSRWINARYVDKGCSIAVEMKKIYMDEWSGKLDEEVTPSIDDALETAAGAVRDALALR